MHARTEPKSGEDLASQAAALEEREDVGPRESWELMRALVEERYTLPAAGSAHLAGGQQAAG